MSEALKQQLKAGEYAAAGRIRFDPLYLSQRGNRYRQTGQPYFTSNGSGNGHALRNENSQAAFADVVNRALNWAVCPRRKPTRENTKRELAMNAITPVLAVFFGRSLL